MADTNTGAQSGAPALSGNFEGQKPADASAPGGVASPVDGNERGKDGTQK